MSRTQWWSLTALLAVVVGLLCGPAASTTSSDAAPGALGPAAAAAPASAAAQTPAEARTRAQAPVAEAADAGTPVPGCGKLRDHDGEPAVPSRARAAYDQAPGLAPWGLPAATGALPAEPPPGIRVRALVPVTPTPVELSVLRV
ncbi:hypothetical protein OH733_19545 [Streptomyces griseus]|uniref:hypothetical protein n=1 Tax=Streptomyces griseus TaxID=1911 RepID=UPI00386B1BCE|nr:hypothetical protein OH733_19545 [Streptomyces griseus]WTD68573.1 hypothetical protein OH763_17445 [Streptomyces griseus]